MSIGLILGFIALFGLWFLLRLTLFFSDRIGSVTMPQDLYPICTWLLRAILIIIAVSVTVIALPGALFGIAMGDAFGGTKSYWAYAVLLSIAVYALSAAVLNFPFFPQHLHERLFFPIHLTLLPCLLLLPYFEAFLMFTGIIGVYHFLWRLCLSDRQKYG